jgi:putative FmdB family regulatory protein
MPIYEYVCEACGERLEQLQRMSDPPLTLCPRCGGALKRAVSAPAFQFKGSGWYVSDYAKKSSVDSAGSSSKSGDSGASKGESGASKSESGASKGDSGKSSDAGSASSSDSASAPAKPATKASE